ncbi:hypothetical protein [Paenibacillus sp. GXUN7292]|uniref:hypothetical protein n=1 Tax=Paenibacillus sp. GXUN7292 TaxID=3422499 RepID=UPI003D7E06A2
MSHFLEMNYYTKEEYMAVLSGIILMKKMQEDGFDVDLSLRLYDDLTAYLLRTLFGDDVILHDSGVVQIGDKLTAKEVKELKSYSFSLSSEYWMDEIEIVVAKDKGIVFQWESYHTNYLHDYYAGLMDIRDAWKLIKEKRGERKCKKSSA